MTEPLTVVLNQLNAAGIAYEIVYHAPVYTIAEMEAQQIEERGQICKNLFLEDAKGEHYYLVMLPKEKTADLKAMRDKLQSARLHFASAEKLAAYLGLSQGSVGPLGLLNDKNCVVEAVIDAALIGKTLGMHPNDNAATIWLAYEDLLALIRAKGNRVMVLPL